MMTTGSPTIPDAAIEFCFLRERHPMGCMSAKLTASLLREMPRRNVKYGMVTMCVGGGMGAAAIFEAAS